MSENPDLNPEDSREDWMAIKRLVYQRVRDIQTKGITFGRRKNIKQRKNILHGGRASSLKKTEDWYKIRRKEIKYGRRRK